MTAAAVIAMSFVNCDRLIAAYNYNAWQSGQLEELDVNHLGQLNDAAVPVLWELAQSEDEDIRLQARAHLSRRANDLLGADWDVYNTNPHPECTVPPPMVPRLDLRAWNRDTARAMELLYIHWDSFYIVDFWEYIYL